MQQQCTKCLKTLEPSEFRPQKSWCKECERADNRERNRLRRADPVYNQQRKSKEAARRLAATELARLDKLARKLCQQCGVQPTKGTTVNSKLCEGCYAIYRKQARAEWFQARNKSSQDSQNHSQGDT